MSSFLEELHELKRALDSLQEDILRIGRPVRAHVFRYAQVAGSLFGAKNGSSKSRDAAFARDWPMSKAEQIQQVVRLYDRELKTEQCEPTKGNDATASWVSDEGGKAASCLLNDGSRYSRPRPWKCIDLVWR